MATDIRQSIQSAALNLSVDTTTVTYPNGLVMGPNGMISPPTIGSSPALSGLVNTGATTTQGSGASIATKQDGEAGQTTVASNSGAAIGSGATGSASNATGTIAPPPTNPAIAQRAKTNPLDAYTDVTYHVTFGMVSQAVVSGVQKTRLSTSVPTLGSGDVTIFASTGDNETVTDHTRDNYFNIRSLAFTNAMSHEPQNPLMAVMFDIHMRIFEPYGFGFYETLADIMNQMGYANCAPARVTYQLQIWFSGYNQDTGQWVPQIPVGIPGSSLAVMTHYVSVSALKAHVTHVGTEYELSLVPFMMGINTGDMTLDADSVYTGQSNTFGAFLQAFADVLSNQKGSRSKKLQKRNYEFVVPDWLQAQKFDTYVDAIEKHYLNTRSSGGFEVPIGQNVDVVSVLTSVLNDLPATQNAFLQTAGSQTGGAGVQPAGTTDQAFTTPSMYWHIRFNVIYGAFDATLNDYNPITYQYVIEPWYTFRMGPLDQTNYVLVTAQANQAQRAQAMTNYNMVLREYHYIFTGQNTEIINTNLDLNAFFFMPIQTFDDTLAGRGAHTPQTPTHATSDTRDIAEGSTTSAKQLANQGSSATSTSVTNPIGQPGPLGQSAPDPLARLKALPYSMYPQQYDVNAITARAASLNRKQRHLQALDFYTSSDFMKIEFEVRGDPIWMFNPYMAGGDGISQSIQQIWATSTVDRQGVSVRAFGDHIINLIVHVPIQQNFMNPVASWTTNQPSLLNGYYLVTLVTSTFEGGRFTQKINAVKYSHMNYYQRNQTSPPAPSPAPTSVAAPTGGTDTIISNPFAGATT